MRRLKVDNGFLAEATEALRKGQAIRIKINGQSMYPFIRGGRDIVELVPFMAAEQPELWKCYLCYWKGTYFVHRYIGIKGDACLFLGDGNLARVEEVERNNVIGLLNRIQRSNGKTTDCNSRWWLIKGRLWVYLRPLRIFILPLLKKIYRP